MAEIKNIGRLFVVYGRDPVRWTSWSHGCMTVHIPVRIGREHVVEDTEYEENENHRDGDATNVHLGGWCFGVGVFEKGLSAEMLRRIEEEAVWLDDVEPGSIGRWPGTREPGATGLGYEYVVRREEADEGRAADPGYEHDTAQGHGGEPVLSGLRRVR